MMMALRSASPLVGEDSKSARDAVECLDALGEGFGTLIKSGRLVRGEALRLYDADWHPAIRHTKHVQVFGCASYGLAILSHKGRGGREGCHVG
jgi:hypothetical protein